MEPQRAMNEFIKSLKECYIERQLDCEEQWPPVRGDRLINLQLVETDKTEGFGGGSKNPGDKLKCSPILYSELFKIENGKRLVRKLIVEGNAGTGKTTLCTMLAEEWAEDKIFTQFECVLLLPLRDHLIVTASSLSDLLAFFHPDENIYVSAVQHLKRTRGKGLLIIADGWDELSEENQSKKSLFYNLLFGRVLPSASILLTSRPSASASLHDLRSIDRLVEVVGFNERNIRQYIESEFEDCPEKASSLVKQLKNNPVIQSVCSIPLNCAIICNLWHTLDQTLPETLTELYIQIILSIILRNMKKKKIFTDLISISLDSIPSHSLNSFWLICKFACKCLSTDQIVFSEEELASSFPEILDRGDKFLGFGLLQSAKSLLPVNHGLSFHFIHLTIQEFLAALHLVTLSNEEKLQVLNTHAWNDRFAMVWRFMFGLGCNQEGTCSKRVVNLDNKVIDHIISRLGSNTLLLCHCSLESKNTIVSLKVASQLNGQLEGYIGSRARNPNDYAAIFHVLNHTLHCSDVRLDLCRCSLRDEQLKELTGILSNADGKLQVKVLTLFDNNLTDRGINDLFILASTSFSFLKQLSLNWNSITDIKPLFAIPNLLSYLSLSDNPFNVPGIQSLDSAIRAGSLFNLIELYLSNTLTDDADINGALLTTLLSSIASHCPQLRYLDLSRNYLGIPGASALGETFLILTCNKSRFELDISDTSTSESLTVFSNILASKIDEGFCTCRLKLNGICDSGHNGLLAIFKLLRTENCCIASLYLEKIKFLNTQVDDVWASKNNLLSFIPPLESSNLSFLSLSNNCLRGSRIELLFECIRICVSLQRLFCWKCSLTSCELVSLLNSLKSKNISHKQLHEWFLRGNSIDDEGASTLLDSQPTLFPSLKNINFEENPVSKETFMKCFELQAKRIESTVLSEEVCFEMVDHQERNTTQAIKSAVLIEWKRMYSPPQNGQLNMEFWKMWKELLWEIQYQIYTLLRFPHLFGFPSLEASKALHGVSEVSRNSDQLTGSEGLFARDTSLDVESHSITDSDTMISTPTVVGESASLSADLRKTAECIEPALELTLHALTVELDQLTNPIKFGILLQIPQNILEVIQYNHHLDTEGQKIALFQYIAKNHKSLGITWSSIADALRDIHAGDLSLRIREQYCRLPRNT